MNKKSKYEVWLHDPRVLDILSDVIRSSKKSYFRIDPDGKHRAAPVKLELLALGVNGVYSSRLLQEYPFPQAPFIHNRSAHPVTEAVLKARAARRIQRAAVRALKAEAKAMAATAKQELKDHAAEAIRAIAEIPECLEEALEIATGDDVNTGIPMDSRAPKPLSDEVAERKRLETERRFNKRFQIEARSSGAWGVYDADLETTRLTGRTRQSAFDEVELLRQRRGLSFDSND